MGGYGSSRWHGHSAKRTVDSSLILSVRTLRKDICTVANTHRPRPMSLTWSGGSNIRIAIDPGDPPTVQLSYSVNDTPHVYTVALDMTHKRCWWWFCPECGERCGALYMPPGTNQRFACRACHDLTYQSKLDSHKRRRYSTLF